MAPGYKRQRGGGGVMPTGPTYAECWQFAHNWKYLTTNIFNFIFSGEQEAFI